MTTTTVNNSLFRSLFEKQKLTGNNFLEWYRNLRIVLFTKDKLPFLEQPIPVLPVPPDKQILLMQIRSFFRPYNLERLCHAMTQNLSVSLIVVSLRKEYEGFVQNYNMHSMGKTVNELHAMLKLHEQTLPLKEAPPFAPKPKNPLTPKKDNPAKDVICHQCGEVGHWRRNCPIYLTELMKKKKLS
ncbi:zinc finger, CCHC-type containing protein [Tanacetum coccineum]